MPGREPDMSPPAAAAMRAVMTELSGAASAWLLLAQLLHESRLGADGAAMHHCRGARLEAAAKLIANHSNVLKDIINPSSEHNIAGKPLTQTHLRRLQWEEAQHVNDLLLEVARRLLGRHVGSFCAMRSADPSFPVQATVWSLASEFLHQRIQSNPAAMPGRSPDLSEDAAAAMCAVLDEVASEARSWSQLLSTLDTCNGVDTGAAEAARALITNHARVLRDLVNPSEKLNIEGKALTQRNSLKRAAFSDWWYVDRFLMEVACRLVGPATASHQIADGALRRLDPEEARAWKEAADFLDKRVQSSQAACPGRVPDMSGDAAAAMKTVMMSLRSVAHDALSTAAARGMLPAPRPRRNQMAAVPPAGPTAQGPAVGSAPSNARHEATVVDVSSATNPATPMSADQAVTELTGQGRGFQKWVGSKKAAALLDSWNATMMASLNQKARATHPLPPGREALCPPEPSLSPHAYAYMCTCPCM